MKLNKLLLNNIGVFDMRYFRYKLNYVDDMSGELTESCGLVMGESFSNAVKNLEAWFGHEIYAITDLSCRDGAVVLEFTDYESLCRNIKGLFD